MPSAVNSDVVATRVVSGLTPLISTLFVWPWWAWLYCVTSKTLPVNKSLVGNEEVCCGEETVVADKFLVSLLGP